MGRPDRKVKEEKKNLNMKLSPKTLFKQRDPESSFILFLVPILLTIWVYYGQQSDFDVLFKRFQSLWNKDFYRKVFEYLSAFLLMFWLPYIIIKMIFKKRIRDYGFQLGDSHYGFRFVLIALPILLWAAYVGSGGADMQAEYPLSKSAANHLYLFIIVEIFYLIYYLGWEFFFRGFLLFGLEKRYGALTAILIQTIPSAIVHIGKPASESFGAIFAGLFFGYVAIRTRSIFYPLLLHAVVGIGTDVFVTLRQ